MAIGSPPDTDGGVGVGTVELSKAEDRGDVDSAIAEGAGVTLVIVVGSTVVVVGVGELTRNLTSARKSQSMSEEFENVNTR